MFAILKFLACLAVLQLSHALIVVALEPAWEGKASTVITAAIIIDAVVLLALLA